MRSARSPWPFAGPLPLVLFAVLLAAGLAAAGCAATPRKKAPAKEKTLVKVPGGTATLGDVRHATFGVLWKEGEEAKETTYKVSYIMREGKANVIEAQMGDAGSTSPADNVSGAIRRERVKDYVLGGPISAIVGESRSFEVGKSYDSVMLRPDGRPVFRYTCDREMEVAGLSGHHLVVSSVKAGTTEVEFVVHPSFPFPLYIREHTGERPIQIILREKN